MVEYLGHRAWATQRLPDSGDRTRDDLHYSWWGHAGMGGWHKNGVLVSSVCLIWVTHNILIALFILAQKSVCLYIVLKIYSRDQFVGGI